MNYPALDRATDAAYPPGSTFKPVTALAAMQEHLIQPYDARCPARDRIAEETDRSSRTGTRS